MKLPRLAIVLGRLLPPAVGAEHVGPLVAVDVANAQTVREFAGAGDFFSGRARLTDRVHFPGLGRVGTGAKPGHLALVLFALRLPTHDQYALAGAEQVFVDRRLVTGAVPEQMRLPVARLVLGVFVPVARLAGERDHND